MDLVDKFGRGNCSRNKAKKIFVSIKGPTGADYLPFNHVSHIVSNFAKNFSDYLNPDAKKTFDQLCQAFIKVPILQHFDPEQYIQVKTDEFGYAISRVLSQLNNNPGQWHPVVYYSQKMIPVKT